MAKLPYTTNRWCSLLHYLRYVAMPSSDKTHWLITLAQHDPFYANIVTTLDTYGYDIEHRFFGQNGAYLPTTIEATEDCVIEDAVKEQHAQGHIGAEFSFSSRYGGAQISHYFLHELMHFWQDLHGLFLTPLITKDASPVMLDASSHIAVTCLCEAMAETESLRASWRLKQSGHPIAWQGALASLDWGKHARAYAKDVQAMPEPTAARHAFDRWYQSRQRPYYEKQALRAYQRTIKELVRENIATRGAQLRSVNLDQLIQMLPQSEQPSYLTLPEERSLNDTLYMTIQHSHTAQQVQAHEQNFSVGTNPNFTEIQSGAAPYIWKSSHHSSHNHASATLAQ